MLTITVSEARSNLPNLMDTIAISREPILITGKRNNAVLLSQEDWRSICESLYLLAVPGMRESLREGMGTPLDDCDEAVAW